MCLSNPFLYWLRNVPRLQCLVQDAVILVAECYKCRHGAVLHQEHKPLDLGRTEGRKVCVWLQLPLDLGEQSYFTYFPLLSAWRQLSSWCRSQDEMALSKEWWCWPQHMFLFEPKRVWVLRALRRTLQMTACLSRTLHQIRITASSAVCHQPIN